MGGLRFLKSNFTSEETAPQVYILLPVGGGRGPSRAEKVFGFVWGALILLAAILFAWLALTGGPSGPCTVKHPENLRGGNPNSQVIGDHLGGLDRPDVRVGEERGAGELQP